ncbi:MAG TPA: (4Fe-4S)-binding protein [bacterium (Candidatus Stahlbacteria)]|nr:(4Fe-4S)-binding protein [Candidatus Stahlbacteria bacterium]
MIISVASGKGGTGKTTIATSLALSFKEEITFLDCDVEEPNAYFFIRPEITNRSSFDIPIPKINYERCTFCGRCSEVCAYNAIAVVPNKVLTFPELCHGCGCCISLCPEEAMVEVPRVIGMIETGRAGKVQFIQGRLNIGEPSSTPIIRAMKKLINREDLVIIDAPPGNSCPVIEAVRNSDYTILVTEPTPFGLYDLDLAVKMLGKLKIDHGIVINRAGIGDQAVERFARDRKIPIITQIAYDREIARTYAQGGDLSSLPPIMKAMKEIAARIL